MRQSAKETKYMPRVNAFMQLHSKHAWVQFFWKLVNIFSKLFENGHRANFKGANGDPKWTQELNMQPMSSFWVDRRCQLYCKYAVNLPSALNATVVHKTCPCVFKIRPLQLVPKNTCKMTQNGPWDSWGTLGGLLGDSPQKNLGDFLKPFFEPFSVWLNM